LQRREASASCVLDRTAPVCVGILARSSTDLEMQQRTLEGCRTQLAESKIGNGSDLLLQLNASEVMEDFSQEQLLQRFFHLSLDEGKALIMRLKCNTSSEIVALPSVVNVFFEQSAKTPFVDYNPMIDGRSDAESSQDEDPEDDLPIRRMKSTDPILLKNQTAVSAFISPASKGGKAIHGLPECVVDADNDEVGSFHVEIVPFARAEVESVKRSVEPFGGAKDSGDDEQGDEDASRSTMRFILRKIQQIISLFVCLQQNSS
jgi:hypothetical protein